MNQPSSRKISMLCRTLALLLTFGLLATVETSFAQENNEPPAGFRSLFNGSDLSGWHGMGHFDPYKLDEMSAEEQAKMRSDNQADVENHWTVEDGELVNDGQGVYLTTNESFRDFELWIDYKTVAKADSGIYLKATPQIQIWDFTEAGGKWNIGADKGSGGLWNNSAGAAGKDPSVLADKPFGEWNRFHIIQVGARTTIWLNGEKVVDHAIMENFWKKNPKEPLRNMGPIQLQTHGGEIRWRNIFIKELDSEAANQYLAEHNDEGFESIFNGTDFTGWAGPTENYSIEAGVLMCKPNRGGTIFTEAEYSDFQVALEFQVPPGGNNGLAIRYPGSGDTAYMGMCELQVLDNTHTKYAKLDERQYHGSAYGIAAAKRGYLRPAGEWNYQVVTVVGTQITVELNGTVILDADLSQVTEYMANRPHPGKDRMSGHFGFAGHSDPVKFREVKIKPLD